MRNPVNWFEIYVQDINRARTFYETVLGIELNKMQGTEFEMWAFPMDQDSFGASGALIKIPGYASGNNSSVIYFSCSDCATTCKQVEETGGQIETAKKSIGPYGYIALVFDTEGNIIGLHSMK